MPYPKFDRSKLSIKSLNERQNKVVIDRDAVPLDQQPQQLSPPDCLRIGELSQRIRTARKLKKSVMLAFGAHTIKNGMAPVLKALMKDGWLTHLATNGAGIIHDWEFAFQGKSSEDVRRNVELGQFGLWEETGFFINLALTVGAYEGLGYGESVGKMIFQEGLQIPDPVFLVDESSTLAGNDPAKAAAAIDLAATVRQFKLKPGFMSIPHRYRQYSVQAKAYELKIPFTGHPMFGHDIIYMHPANLGAAIGRTAQNDFLTFAGGVSNLDQGVYMSVGSAVMSPMIFEKSLSMSRNLAIREKHRMNNHYIMVVDIAGSEWDWKRNGEPPPEHPAYYLRYCKTFNRMGGEMEYLTADNRDFLLELYHQLTEGDSVNLIKKL